MARAASTAGGTRTPLARLLDRIVRRARRHGPERADDPRAGRGGVRPLRITPRVDRDRSSLDPEVRALVARLVAITNGSGGSASDGRPAVQRRGLAPSKLLAVGGYATDPRFLPDERAALAFAAAVAEGGGLVPSELVAELRRHFSDRDIVDLTMVIARANAGGLAPRPRIVRLRDHVAPAAPLAPAVTGP